MTHPRLARLRAEADAATLIVVGLALVIVAIFAYSLAVAG